MRKLRCIAFIAAAVLLGVLSGCGGGSDGSGGSGPAVTQGNAGTQDGSGTQEEMETDTGGETDVPYIACEDVLAELLKRVPTTNCDTRTVSGDGTYEEYFEYLYDVSLDKAADGAFGYASAAYADEITVIRLADIGDADKFLDKLEDRIDRRKQDFEGYKPEEVAKLDGAQTASAGSYVLMAVCGDADKVKNEFLKMLGED